MNTQNQIATMATVQEKVKERIQASFMDLIPPELWEGMVEQHLREFTRDVLPKLVKDEAEKRVRGLLAEEFKKPEWQDRWDFGNHQASDMLTSILKEVAPHLVAAMFGSLAANIVADIRNNPNRY
jgi:hypothetical protein